MVTPNKTTTDKDREEDFRDYQQRDLGEGWPYADSVPVKKRNAAYGDTSDELDPTNTEITNDTFIESDGGPTLFPDEEIGNITDDGIEEEVANRISDSGKWNDNQLTVTVHNGVVDIDGEVDTEHERQLINQIALRTPGVKFTRNNLILIGADSHIPSDADE